MIVRKSPMEIDRMHASGQLVGRILAALHGAVKPGATTMDLERQALGMIREARCEAGLQGLLCSGGRQAVSGGAVHVGE